MTKRQLKLGLVPTGASLRGRTLPDAQTHNL